MRTKRSIKGEDIVAITLEMRASVHDKLLALMPAGASKVGTIEQMTEYLFAKRLRKISQYNQQNEI